MKKTLKKSPVIAFAEVLCQRAVEICSAANNGEDPEIIIKAWDGSFEEEIKRVTGSLETVIVMERPEIVPDQVEQERQKHGQMARHRGEQPASGR